MKTDLIILAGIAIAAYFLLKNQNVDNTIAPGKCHYEDNTGKLYCD